MTRRHGTRVNSWLCSNMANLPLDSWTVPREFAGDGLAIGGGANGEPFVAASSPPTRAVSRSHNVARRLRR